MLNRGWFIAVIAMVMFAFGASPAWAHNTVTSSTPADGATLAVAPTSVTLTFVEPLDPGTELTVTDSGGASAIGKATISGKTVSAPFTASTPGQYTVSYKTVSADGDPTSGSRSFTIANADTGTLAPTQPPTQSPLIAPEPTVDTTKTASSSSNTWWWVAGIALLIVITGGVVFLLRRRRSA